MFEVLVVAAFVLPLSFSWSPGVNETEAVFSAAWEKTQLQVERQRTGHRSSPSL